MAQRARGSGLGEASSGRPSVGQARAAQQAAMTGRPSYRQPTAHAWHNKQAGPHGQGQIAAVSNCIETLVLYLNQLVGHTYYSLVSRILYRGPCIISQLGFLPSSSHLFTRAEHQGRHRRLGAVGGHGGCAACAAQRMERRGQGAQAHRRGMSARRSAAAAAGARGGNGTHGGGAATWASSTDGAPGAAWSSRGGGGGADAGEVLPLRSWDGGSCAGPRGWRGHGTARSMA